MATDFRSMTDAQLLAQYQANRPLAALSDEELISAHQQAQRLDRLAELKRKNPAEYDPESKEFQAKYGPTGTRTQNFMAGAGKAVVDIGRGVKQIGGQVGNLAGLVSDETVQKTQADIDASRERDAPLMRTGAGLTGNIAGTLATTLIPAGVAAKGAQALNLSRTAAGLSGFVNPQTVLGAATAGGVQGALQPVATGESRILNTALGAGTGALATAAAKGVGRLAQPVKKALTSASQKAAQTLEDAGVPLDLAQRTGSRFVQRMKNMLQDNPVTAGSQAAFREQQQRAYNKAVLSMIGENADAATPDVMGRVQARLGQVFDDIAARNPIKYDKGLEMRLASIARAARNELDDSQYGVISRQIDTILDKAANGVDQIDGKAYQNIKTSLDRLSLGQDQSKGYHARMIREALDDALQRSATPQDVAALKIARGQYRRMKQIESAIATDESGHISAAKLANSLGTKRNVSQSKYGKGDQGLVQLAKAGKQILPEPTPNSGTPARLLAQFALPGALGIAGGIASDDPMTGVKLGVATYMIPKLASGAIKPGPISNYLANGLGNPYVRAVLTSPQSNTLAGALIKGAPTALALSAPQQNAP